MAVNKWDLVEDKTDRTFDQYTEWIRNEVPFLDFAPIVSISAKTGQRVGRVLELAVDIWAERRRRISTGELNRLLQTATERTPPPPVRGKRPKLFYATQAAIAPPTFVFFASDASAVHFSYRRYLENRLRETFGFDGTPIRLVVPRPGLGQAAAPQEGARRRPSRKTPQAGDKGGKRHDAASRPPDPLMGEGERAARRGHRRRRVGHDAGPPRRPGRARHAAVPQRGDGRPASARPAATSRGCRAWTCRRPSWPRPIPRCSPAATDLLIFAAPSAHLRTVDDARARRTWRRRPTGCPWSRVSSATRCCA